MSLMYKCDVCEQLIGSSVPVLPNDKRILVDDTVSFVSVKPSIKHSYGDESPMHLCPDCLESLYFHVGRWWHLCH
jgi:hypothetical protein